MKVLKKMTKRFRFTSITSYEYVYIHRLAVRPENFEFKKNEK